MLNAIAAAFLLGLSVTAHATETSEKQLARDLKNCAPQNYEAALLCLDRVLPEDQQAALAAPDDTVQAHFGLGMFLRNNWGLWQQGPLYRSMQAMGFTHPDDMSGAILGGFAARERGEAFTPNPPDQAELEAEWNELVRQGRAGSMECPRGPEPKNQNEAVAAMEACLDFISKSLESDQK